MAKILSKERVLEYSKEFRKESVRRADQKGVTQAQVANELGISAQQIAN